MLISVCVFFLTIIPAKSSSIKHCEHQLDEYRSALDKNYLWAVKMQDATAKVPSGLLSGNKVTFGSFDQCLSVLSNSSRAKIIGKYCLGEVLSWLNFSDTNEEKLWFKWGVCIPNKCTIERLRNDPSLNFFPEYITDLKNFQCQTVRDLKPEFTYSSIATLLFLGLLILIVIISTIYEIISYNIRRSFLDNLIVFSAVSNTKFLFEESKSPKYIHCLDGMRVISAFWVIIRHSFGIRYDYFHPITNSYAKVAWEETVYSVSAKATPFAVDTFLLLSGLVLGYNHKMTFNGWSYYYFVCFYVRRILRIVPTLAIIVLFCMNLIQYTGSGPLWPYMLSTVKKPCEWRWWSAILLIQNFWGTTRLCHTPSWYLNVDMQLYVISPILIYLYEKSKIAAVILITILVFLSLGFSFTPYKDYYGTLNRAGPWFIGLLVGLHLGNRNRFQKCRIFILPTLCVSIAILASILFTSHRNVSGSFGLFIAMLKKCIWAAAVSWVIVTCHYGQGGIVNDFLNLPLFKKLSKLTYSIYLVHFPIQYIIVGNSRATYPFNGFSLLYTSFSDAIFSIIVAYIMVLLVEFPMMILEKKLLRKIDI